MLLACSQSGPTQVNRGTDMALAVVDAGGDLAGNRPSTDLLLPAPADNVAPMIVDDGPPGTESVDVPFISVTLCVPGTSTCQTIDHVSVDTGSSGLRMVSTALAGLQLPQVGSLVECYQFADGYTWGSVRLADVKIAGEVAANLPIQVLGDSQSAVPGDCSSVGPSENTIADFGANGLIGINQLIPDCGSYCSDTRTIGTGAYYSCSGACSAVAVPDAQQVSNPIAFFAKDNNGALLELPDVGPSGATSLSGVLVFGIGTAANNGLGAASILTVDANGNFTTVYKGATLDTSFIDSGTNSLSFNDSSIKECGGADVGFFCPPSTLSLTATNQGQNGVTTNISFSVANADMLFANPNNWVFDNLGGPGYDNSSFAWGLPFFFGRSVFVGLDGKSSTGPYFAY